MHDCIFCKIIAGGIPAEIVADNPGAIAFRDIDPAAPVHLLVVPRRHIPDLEQMSDEEAVDVTACMQLVRDVARDVGLVPGGYRVVSNNGADAGQEVPHLHFHVLGGRKLGWSPA